MATDTIQDWGSALMTSLTGAMAMLLGAIPRIIGFLVIVIIGWLIAALIARGVAMLLRAVHFNDLSQKAGVSDFVSRMGVRSDSSGVLALIVKWFIRLIALVVAFDALGLPAVSSVLHDFLRWLPNLVVALVVLVIGGLAARALASVVRGATAKAQLGNPDFIARIAAGAVWVFTAVVAVNQLGIAQTLVNTLFIAVTGATALALGLSFGLGGRETAAELLRQWRQRGQQAAVNLREASSAEAARGDAPGAVGARGPVPSP